MMPGADGSPPGGGFPSILQIIGQRFNTEIGSGQAGSDLVRPALLDFDGKLRIRNEGAGCSGNADAVTRHDRFKQRRVLCQRAVSAFRRRR